MTHTEINIPLKVERIETEFGTVYTCYKGPEYLFTCKSEDDLISRIEIYLRGCF